MIIAKLHPDNELLIHIKAIHEIECRLCGAGEWYQCRQYVGTQEDLAQTVISERLPIHKVRIEDSWPLYEAAVSVAEESLRQEAIAKARAKYQGSDKTHSDFYEPAGPEIDVECDYCNAEPGRECITLYGSFTKSHALRLNKYNRMNRIPTPEELYPCTSCGARPGHRCVTTLGEPAQKSHSSRLDQAYPEKKIAKEKAKVSKKKARAELFSREESYDCQLCKAEPGHKCTSPSGATREVPHASRFKQRKHYREVPGNV